MRARSGMLIPLVLVGAVACASPLARLERGRAQAWSWSASVDLAGEAWLSGRVTGPYLRVCLDAAEAGLAGALQDVRAAKGIGAPEQNAFAGAATRAGDAVAQAREALARRDPAGVRAALAALRAASAPLRAEASP